MKTTFALLSVAVVVLTAGCTSSNHNAETTAKPTPAPVLTSLKGQFGQELALSIAKDSPQGKGVPWSLSPTKATDTTVTVDWSNPPTQECGRASTIRLEQTTKSITIQIVPAKQVASACSSSSENFSTPVKLSAPLKNRSVLQQ